MTALNPTPDQPLRKSAQRLRWFIAAFQEQIEQTSTETGNLYSVDNPVLAEVFADWLKAFEAQKPSDIGDKAAYVGFAAGLMLRTLIKRQPVRIDAKPQGADDANPAYFWPEGYVYVAFCLNVRGLVLEQDFDGQQRPSESLQDTRTWWSFKENVSEDPGLAIAFLDLFAGDDPNWDMPELFRSGMAGRVAQRFYAPRTIEQDPD